MKTLVSPAVSLQLAEHSMGSSFTSSELSVEYAFIVLNQFSGFSQSINKRVAELSNSTQILLLQFRS